MRKVGRVMCSGLAGSRARLAECLGGGFVIGWFNEDVRRGKDGDGFSRVDDS